MISSASATSPDQSDSPLEVESAHEFDQNELSDGRYCAEVDYSNDQTGRKSNNSLVVHVMDQKVTCIYLPQGGHLASDHFRSSFCTL